MFIRCLIFFFILIINVSAEEISGIPRIIDGDTIYLGKSKIRLEGSDITVVSIGYTIHDALKVAERLKSKNINLEIIDPVSLSPIDSKTIIESVKKTGRLVVLDHGWKSYGAAAEIISLVSEQSNNFLKTSPLRITFPDSHTPMSSSLEKEFYINEELLLKKIQEFYG